MYPLIHLTDQIQLPTYLIIISLTYCAGIFWIVKRSYTYQLNPYHTLNLCLNIIIGGFIGSRLLHILYENPSFYLKDPASVFKIWQGGFVFYGGLIGAFASSYLYTRIKKINFNIYADLFTPLFPAGYAIGRTACFLNGCCFGTHCELPWAVTFLSHSPSILPRHPTQIYAMIFELLILVSIFYLSNKKEKFKIMNHSGQIFYFWLFFHAWGRIFMESFRDDFRGDTILSLSLSTWISVVLILFAGIQLRRGTVTSASSNSSLQRCT